VNVNDGPDHTLVS